MINWGLCALNGLARDILYKEFDDDNDDNNRFAEHEHEHETTIRHACESRHPGFYPKTLLAFKLN
jgi:hypothetical protein